MLYFLIGLIWLSVGGIALALYLYRRERSRQDVVERVIGTSGVTEVRHRILRPASGGDANTLRGKVLSKAPQVWAKNASTQALLVQAGYDSPQAPLAYSMLRLISLVVFPLVAFVGFPNVGFMQRVMYAVLGAVVGLVLPIGYLHRSVRLHQQKIRRSLPDALD